MKADVLPLYLRPWTVKQALPFVAQVHRRQPRIQGALWAVSVRRDAEVVGCALVGHPARVWMHDHAILCVLRVAVVEGVPNACSMLYGACSKAARAMGADGLVTYTHLDESGHSLRVSGWVRDKQTDGGEWSRPSRPRRQVVDSQPKVPWWAPWSIRAKEILKEASAP